jgi:phosphatidylglycerophosphate synthase
MVDPPQSGAGTGLPPFAALLKSRDVEDPINIWVHRTLAYAFVAAIYRTRITPNQITLVALLVGIAAGVCFFIGTPQAMVSGGILLWSSAILDGADGILARAKRMFSDLGRALDGAADGLVALATVPVAFYHLWLQHHSLLELSLMPFAIGCSLFHIYLYDYYKEAYLQHTRPDWNGEPERVADVIARAERLKAERAPWVQRAASDSYVNLIQMQIAVVKVLNPPAARHHLTFPVSAESARIFRQYNWGPMQLWAIISLAPHSYLMSICAMFDRLDVYLWLRVFGANAVFVWVCLWQRVATRRTNQALERSGLAPRPLAPAP